MRPVLILLGLLITGLSQAQMDIDHFRKFEKRVRFVQPDSLLVFADKLDTTRAVNTIFKYLATGKFHYQNSEFDKAFNILSKAKTLAVNEDELILSAEIALDISSCLSILENTGKALDELLYAKRVFDESGNNNQKARLYIAMGELYRKIGQYDKAVKMLIQGKKFINRDPGLMASYYNRRAAIKSETTQMDSAYYFSKKALESSKKSDDISLTAISENEIGYILWHKDKKDSAIIHFMKADSIFRKCNMTAYALQSTLHYTSLLSEKGGRKEINRKYLLPGFRMASENNWYRLKRDYAERLRNNYGALHVMDSFYFYRNEMNLANIALIQSQNEMNTKLIESIYQQEKYENEINDKEQLLKEARSQREKAESEKSFMTLIILLGVVVLLLLTYMVFFQIKRRKKMYEDNLEKEKQNKALEILLKNNEALVQEISHRVKNNLSVLSGLIGIQKVRAANPEIKKELGEIILRIDSISAIHNQLYDTKEASQINLNKVFRELSDNVCLAMGYSPENILLFELEEIALDIARAVNLSMILNELLTNSFKHAVKTDENKIRIKLKHENKNIILSVVDQGKGMDNSTFEFNSGTTGSMGLYLIDILCRQLKAKKELKHDGQEFNFSVIFEN